MRLRRRIQRQERRVPTHPRIRYISAPSTYVRFHGQVAYHSISLASGLPHLDG
jgi:hypothetical protein